MSKSHSDVNASSTMAGFQFQVNVAIYFMLRYLKDIDSIRVEGEKEDVEVNLKDKHRYMIQAKAQTIDLKDNKNNAKNLKDALKTLANADEKDVQYLFYASNMSDPLNSSDEVFKKYDIVTKMYNELSKNFLVSSSFKFSSLIIFFKSISFCSFTNFPQSSITFVSAFIFEINPSINSFFERSAKLDFIALSIVPSISLSSQLD